MSDCADISDEILNRIDDIIDSAEQSFGSTINKKTGKKTINFDCGIGTQCYNDKITEELKQLYLEAKNNLANAPGVLNEREKKYFISKYGEYYYNNLLKERAKNEASSHVVIEIDNYVKDTHVALGKTETVSAATKTYEDMDVILSQATDTNKQLINEISKLNNSNLTNNRRSYYEQENYNILKKWYYIWFYIYIILLIIFVFTIFLTDSTLSIMSKISIILLFILYLFIAKPILIIIINFIYYIISFIPKNFYLLNN
jgi:hypothetical protein